VDTPPLHALASGASGPNGVYAYGSSSVFPNQTWNAANYWVDVQFLAGAAPSLDSIIVTPANPSIPAGASQRFTATGNYSDGTSQDITSQVAWSSLNSSIATISSAGIASGLSAGNATITASLGTISGTASLTVQGGGSSQTISFWPSSVIPGTVDGGPDSSVELGVKFRTDVSGRIRGIRFYKHSLNTGSHIGNLWTAQGVLLASATFSNETSSGWQEVLFSSPISISPNTVYVASYHCNNGHYSGDVNYFTSAGVDNPPLHALASGVSGMNGVYAYGGTSVFPSLSWQSGNYWVDVKFAAGSQGDVTPPTIISASPANNSTAILNSAAK